ncbi:MAG: hypothetical protein U9R42_01310 [Bacteroidota bacterium]|nr:hypothetical protein [Bacteroidota bacterium]
MKKSVFLIAFMIFLSSFSFAQSKYKVIRVNGTILIKKSGKELSSGLIFSENDELNFKTQHSKAAVINPKKGRMILTAGNDGSSANFLPAMSNIASRGGIALNKIDLRNEFSGNILIINEYSSQVSSTSFPLSEKSFFFIRYQHNGEEINKQLTYNEDVLIINKSELLKIDNKAIEDFNKIKSMKLYYYQNEKSILISEFFPILPDLASLKNEVQIIWDEFPNKPWSFKSSEISSYLSEFYGKTNKKDLNTWLKKNFK